MKGVIAALVMAGTAGCATTPLPAPEAVTFTQLRAPAKVAVLADHRPASERESRRGRMGNMTYYYLGDGATTPGVPILVAAMLAERAREAALQRVEIGFWQTPRGSRPSFAAPPPFIPIVPSDRPSFVGQLLGLGIIGLLDKPEYVPRPTMTDVDTDTFASAVVEVAMVPDGERVAGRANEPIFPGTKPELALERAVARAVADLASQLQAKHLEDMPR